MPLERMQRQLGSLSDNIFGVSMTMLAFDAQMPPNLGSDWQAVLGMMSHAIGSIALGFVVAALFWISHHRRLTLDAPFSRPQLAGNLLFLLGIVVLPISTRVFNSMPIETGAPLFGLNLTALGIINVALWAAAVRHVTPTWRERARMMVTPLFATGIVIVGAVISPDLPRLAELFWYSAFLGPLIDAKFNPDVA